jgi:hypothetical protein
MERRPLAKQVAGVGGTVLPPHVSIKGNRWTLVDGAGQRHPLNTLSMDCVILDHNAEKMSRMYYDPEVPYDEDNPAAPLCFSDNGIGPSSRSRDPQGGKVRSCKPDRTGEHGCPWSVWGSATSKVDGKEIPACQNGVKLALLMAAVDEKTKKWIPLIRDNDGFKPMVFMLRVPPASLGNIGSYGKTVSGVGKLTIPWTGEEVKADMGYVVTRMEFERQGVISFRSIGYIDKEIDELIDVIPQERVDVAVGRDDEPIAALPAPVKEVPPLPPGSGYKHYPLPQAEERPPAAPAEKRPRGRPPKNAAPAASPVAFPQPSTFEPRPNPNIVTTEDVRDYIRGDAGRMEQEGREAAIHAQGVKAVAAVIESAPYHPNDPRHADPEPAAPGNKFGIVESAPEPPQDALDSFFDLKM